MSQLRGAALKDGVGGVPSSRDVGGGCLGRRGRTRELERQVESRLPPRLLAGKVRRLLLAVQQVVVLVQDLAARDGEGSPAPGRGSAGRGGGSPLARRRAGDVWLRLRTGRRARGADGCATGVTGGDAVAVGGGHARGGGGGLEDVGAGPGGVTVVARGYSCNGNRRVLSIFLAAFFIFAPCHYLETGMGWYFQHAIGGSEEDAARAALKKPQ